jgi:hypothetical protein
MKVIQAPQSLSDIRGKSLFLAGSIEMDTAERWQDRVIHDLKDMDITILNPRRAAWDPSWKQDLSNPQFVEQVTWELDALEQASAILFYFDPNTKSPITLLELGLFAKSPKPLYVCCPDGFWRKGNVDIVCSRYCVAQMNKLESLIAMIRNLPYFQ